MKGGSGSLAAKLHILAKKPSIEAKLPYPVTWEDVLPAFYQIQEPTEAETVAADPEEFIRKMTRSKNPEFGVPWARKLLVILAKEDLEEKLAEFNRTCPSAIYAPAVPAVKEAKSPKRGGKSPKGQRASGERTH